MGGEDLRPKGPARRDGRGRTRRGRGGGGSFARFSPVRWIGAGFAGAISPGLPFGAVVVAAELAGGSGGAGALDPAMARRALACDPGARAARAASSAGIVGSRAEKARLLSAAGGSLPVTVDMESAAWASAARSGLPGVLVRVVTDAADDEIPHFVAASVGPDGRIDRGRLVRHAVLHPSAIGKLLALRRRARVCGERLADFVERFAARGF